MERVRLSLFVGLALGYAGVAFVIGRLFLHSVLGIEPATLIPMPGIILQLVGFGITFVAVVGLTIGVVRLLNLDEM